jgi:hypothetical protein
MTFSTTEKAVSNGHRIRALTWYLTLLLVVAICIPSMLPSATEEAVGGKASQKTTEVAGANRM